MGLYSSFSGLSLINNFIKFKYFFTKTHLRNITSIVVPKQEVCYFSALKSKVCNTHCYNIYIRFHSNKTSKKYCHTRLFSSPTLRSTSTDWLEIVRQNHQNIITTLCILTSTNLISSDNYC